MILFDFFACDSDEEKGGSTKASSHRKISTGSCSLWSSSISLRTTRSDTLV